MQHVFVIDSAGKPLMPCLPGKARKLLEKKRAAVWRRYPFTIMLLGGVTGDTQPLRLKIDPGSRTTGLAIVREDSKQVVWAAELQHRGFAIKSRLLTRRGVRRSRRTRKLRHRPARFNNRLRRDGWLPPSLRHRVLTTMTWVERLQKVAPIVALSYENVSFDAQLMENPNISGVEYQQGELWGYEVKQYLLEKFGYACVYCGAKDVPLEVEHIIPKSRGGGDRVSNLTIACVDCNREKGNRTAQEFGHPDVQKSVKRSLRDAAAVNATRWALWRELEATELPLECGSGGRTKWNRTNLGLPKAHWIDAACVGKSGDGVELSLDLRPLRMRTTGHGTRQMCGTDAYGFPIRHRVRAKPAHGFKTGDMVSAAKPVHLKDGGKHVGRVAAARFSGTLAVRPVSSERRNVEVNHKYCTLLHRADGYDYSRKGPDDPKD